MKLDSIRADRPFHVMAKPAGSNCNLACRYCFYLEKPGVLGLAPGRMDEELLDLYIRQQIEAQPTPEIAFAWQGGEPTLMGLNFFRRVVALQKRHAGGRRITNALQTNGTRLDDQWAAFLARHRFLVGISIDGPRELHDAHRATRAGLSSFDRVMQGIRLLQKHRVEFNTLTTINRGNSAHPLEVYRFLVDEVGSKYLQFIPIVERELSGVSSGDRRLLRPRDSGASGRVTDWSVTPEGYADFLIRIFDWWVHRDVGRVFVQTFDNALANWSGVPGAICVHSESCGAAVAMEANGDVFSCDHYVYPEYLLGNIRRTHLRDLVASPAQRAFGRLKRDALPDECLRCDFRFACHGGCPKHRFLPTADGGRPLNYLCNGYRKFFARVDAPMRVLTALLRARRPPSEIMTILRPRNRAPAPSFDTGISSNGPCPCGSSRPFGSCCGG